MNRILITGASGQLGRSILELAPKYPSMEFSFLDREQLDITNPEQVRQVFEKIRPHYCVNCAAYTKVDQAERTPEPAYAVNVHGVENLVGACKGEGTILIHISTDYVFDGKKKEGYYPGDEPNPINVYGRTKLEGERIIQQNLERAFIIRTSWLYSKKYGPNFYLTILQKAKKGEKLTVTDSQRGCPTDALHLARYILELIKSGSADYGISHFTDGEVMSWFGFAERILASSELQSSAQLSSTPQSYNFARRPENTILL